MPGAGRSARTGPGSPEQPVPAAGREEAGRDDAGRHRPKEQTGSQGPIRDQAEAVRGRGADGEDGGSRVSDEPMRPRVLIVDDSRFDREIAREAVGDAAEVVCCASAEEALERLSAEAFDLVLTDLVLPRRSGAELLAAIRRDHPGVDVILITAHASLDSAVAALRLGAADYLSKPIRPDELAVVLRRTLERRWLAAENLHLRELLATVEECRSLSASLDPSEIHSVALDILLARLGRERGLAWFHRGPSLATGDVSCRGYGEREADRLRAVLSGEKVLDLHALAQPEIVRGGPLHQALAEAGVAANAFLVVPVHGRAAEGGVLVVPEEPPPFAARELELARLVATHAQVAMQNAERYHRAKERAFVDDVTGVYNARYLFTALEHEMRRADRYGSQLALLFLDVDRFKLVNDHHGHLVGSRTLRRLAEVLGNCIRQVDTLARYGGDEFTILLVDTGLETGLTIAERIRAAVAANPFESRGREPLHVTVSIGVAAFPAHGTTPESLLDMADKAMYRAKSLGRDRTCSASDL
jgi:two-component system cell cycle response regulator